ncbi:MAG TPA: FdrA family protein [Nocardioidaceae bacterium]|nr:FdrA family protein [Nocardioidaceae bacterium]
MTRSLTVRKGSYVDSVALMQVSKRVSALPGVRSALVAMATELNLDLATGMGFTLPDRTAPNEMLVAIEADDETAIADAYAEVEAALNARSAPSATGFGTAPPPVTIGAAARHVAAGLALISTPGRYAFADAIDAVDAGLHTMVFSDNVPLEQEVALKRYAADAGVLVMGPDCGTAVVGGVALGFANVVRPGPIGIVAASGTGAQHLMTLLDGAGVGVSHCLGVGGRDLSERVGGSSTLRALDLLAGDEATEVIVIVSKPPSPSVAETVRAHAATLGKPVVFGLLGKGQPDLTETARRTVEATGRTWRAPQHLSGAVDRARDKGFLRGLFAGGTLCDEAMILAVDVVGAVRSNIPLDPAWALDDGLGSDGHTMIDFGDDELTQGRPHPMIDGSIRVERMRAEVADPTCGVLLLDVVLGLGAAADPAAELAPVITEATRAGIPVVAAVVGTRDDPQDLKRQATTLNAAGAWVFYSNAEAARTALDLLAKGQSA